MSKQSEAKKSQGYEPKPIQRVCMNCKHYTSKYADVHNVWDKSYQVEKELRCDLGGFAIKKMGTCKLYKEKERS